MLAYLADAFSVFNFLPQGRRTGRGFLCHGWGKKILEYLIQKEVVREQYVLEKSGKEQDDEIQNQVLKKAVVYLKEGKCYFSLIREKKTENH